MCCCIPFSVLFSASWRGKSLRNQAPSNLPIDRGGNRIQKMKRIVQDHTEVSDRLRTESLTEPDCAGWCSALSSKFSREFVELGNRVSHFLWAAGLCRNVCKRKEWIPLGSLTNVEMMWFPIYKMALKGLNTQTVRSQPSGRLVQKVSEEQLLGRFPV